MRIAVATGGRFHVLDLSRELARLGHDVAFYSYVPAARARRFGLPPEIHRSLLGSVLPWLLMRRIRSEARSSWDRRLLERLDATIANRLERCDIFIGMSGLCVASARVAKEKYGAKVFIERGSRHILSQKAILEAMPTRRTPGGSVPAYAVERELASYKLADVITVPSRHVVESFLEQGVAARRLFCNPYGVDLSMFRPAPMPEGIPPTVIMVGAWSYRKGVDVLAAAWRSLEGVRLVHVGPVADAPLPDEPGFEHHDSVPQWRLPEHYARAHVAALASREEGLSLVQIQALACGLPLVCTDRTGGEDLKHLLGDHDRITVVPHGDTVALEEALSRALRTTTDSASHRVPLSEKQRDGLSWRAYAERYDARLRESLGQPESVFR